MSDQDKAQAVYSAMEGPWYRHASAEQTHGWVDILCVRFVPDKQAIEIWQKNGQRVIMGYGQWEDYQFASALQSGAWVIYDPYLTNTE